MTVKVETHLYNRQAYDQTSRQLKKSLHSKLTSIQKKHFDNWHIKNKNKKTTDQYTIYLAPEQYAQSNI